VKKVEKQSRVKEKMGRGGGCSLEDYMTGFWELMCLFAHIVDSFFSVFGTGRV
jgi:hypothetical protein